jgi:phosphoglycerate dehydrogenase-like enzyme
MADWTLNRLQNGEMGNNHRYEKMKIFKNTATLNGYDDGLIFTTEKAKADLVLMGSKPIDLAEYPNLKGIFRAGIGRENVPINDAVNAGILVRFPSDKTVSYIFEETARFTCYLIFRVLYQDVGTIDPWEKLSRVQLQDKKLLVIGHGNIGKRVADSMRHFMCVSTYDVRNNSPENLMRDLSKADCVSLHVPNTPDNKAFIDKSKLARMKDGSALVNTARGRIVDEQALYHELSSGRLRAAFDVFWEEPYRGILSDLHPDTFFMTPHVASTCSGFLQGCRLDLNSLIEEISDV